MTRLVVPELPSAARQLYAPRREEAEFANERYRQQEKWANQMPALTAYDRPLTTSHTFVNTSYLTAAQWGISWVAAGEPFLQVRTTQPCSLIANINLAFTGSRIAYRLEYAEGGFQVGPVAPRNIYSPAPGGGAEISCFTSYTMQLKANTNYDFDVNLLTTGSTTMVADDTFVQFLIW